MNIYKLLILLSVIFTTVNCNNNNSTNTNIKDTFKNWFINPSAKNKQSLIKQKIKPQNIASIVKDIRTSAKKGTYSTTLIDSNSIEYSVGAITPNNYSLDTLYPLVIYLHGGIGTTKDTKGEYACKMLEGLEDSLKIFLASPSGNRFATWWSPNGMYRILQTLRYMTLNYPIDPNKIFLSGVSDGGTGCYSAANSIQGPFAGFIPISGFGGMLPAMGVPIFPQNIMQRPIYNINAGNDRLYPLDKVTQFIKWLINNGVDVTFKVYENESHGFDYRNKELPNIVNFIRQTKLQSTSAFSWIITPNYPNLIHNVVQMDYKKDVLKRPYITAYWKKDTLQIKQNNFNSINILLPKQNYKKVYCYQNGNKTNVKITNPNIINNLQIMQTSCYPIVTTKKIVKIKF